VLRNASTVARTFYRKSMACAVVGGGANLLET
jgi:hypothetical protein